MEVMPSDVLKSDFFKDKSPRKTATRRIVPSRWASKENFVQSRAKIAEKKVLRNREKEEQLTQQKDNKRHTVSKKEKDRSPTSSQHDSLAQNPASSSPKSIQQEEDCFQSAKNLHRQTESSKQLKGIYFNKTNGFHVTKPRPKKSIAFNQSLPSISTPHNSQPSSASLVSAKQVSIVQFGIFSASKDSQSFLNRLRAAVQQQFSTGIDLNNIFDLNRIQYHLLHEIRKSTK